MGQESIDGIATTLAEDDSAEGAPRTRCGAAATRPDPRAPSSRPGSASLLDRDR